MNLRIAPSGLIFIAFWLFGLINNVLYVVNLSAAIDLVGPLVPKATVLLADPFLCMSSHTSMCSHLLQLKKKRNHFVPVQKTAF